MDLIHRGLTDVLLDAPRRVKSRTLPSLSPPLTTPTTPSSSKKRLKKVRFCDPVVQKSPAVRAVPHFGTLSSQNSCLINSAAEELRHLKLSAPANTLKDTPKENEKYVNRQDLPATTVQVEEAMPAQIDDSSNMSLFKQQYIQSLREAEMDLDSSDGEEIGDSEDDEAFRDDEMPVHVVQDDMVLGQAEKRTLTGLAEPSISEIDPTKQLSIHTGEQSQRRKSPKSESAGASESQDNSGGESRSKLLSQFHEAVQQAQHDADEQGIVNIVEYFAEGSDTPTRVDIPSISGSNRKVEDLQDDEYMDVTEYLDVTFGKTKIANTDSRAFMTERERREANGELDTSKLPIENPKDITKSISNNKRKGQKSEEKEFGAGFAKGFFSKVKRKTSSKNTTATSTNKRVEDKQCVSANAKKQSSPGTRTPEKNVKKEVRYASGTAVGNVIEEKKTRRRSRKSRTVRRAKTSTAVPNLEVVKSKFGVEAPQDLEQLAVIEPEEEEEVEEGVSEFRLLQELKRESAVR